MPDIVDWKWKRASDRAAGRNLARAVFQPWALFATYGHDLDQTAADSDRDRAGARAAARAARRAWAQTGRADHGRSSGPERAGLHRALPGDGRALGHRGYPEFDPDQPRDDNGRWSGGGYDSEAAGPDLGADVKTVHSLTPAGAAIAQRYGITPVAFHELKPEAGGAERFHQAISAAKTGRFAAAVHVYEPDEYRGMRLFVTPDNKAGFALKPNGDIVSAFKHPDSSAQKVANAALALAVQQGGRRLDAFDTVLPAIYARSGFRTTARLAFNDEFAPPGWDRKTFGAFNGGRPDVVFMHYDPEQARDYAKDDGPRVASYEEGVAAQDKAIAEVAARRKFWQTRQPGHDVSDEPRDEQGRWTEGGGGDGGDGGAPLAAPASPDPAVTNVGGDAWNKATAQRLEREYQDARPAVDKIVQESVGHTLGEVEVDEDEEEGEPPYEPEEWDGLSASGQSEAESSYIEKNLDDYYQSEVDSWMSEYARDEAKEKLASDFNDGSEQQWAMDALNDLRDERADAGAKDFPFGNNELLKAIRIDQPEGQGGSWPKKDTELIFDDDKLNEMRAPDPDQPQFAGIEPPNPALTLTPEMRDDIEKALLDAFDKEVDNVIDKLEPPEYLHDNAKEFAGESWDEMSDKDKFEWTKNNTSIVENESTDGTGSYSDKTPADMIGVDKLPEKYDPLNETSGSDYQRTQQVARYLSVERALQVMQQRKIVFGDEEETSAPSAAQLARIDSKLWSQWKASSTTTDGKLLQLATADELGGRLNTSTHHSAGDINRADLQAYANKVYASIGGYEGIKAYVRAKWETTQYLLDKAGIKNLELYRGIKLKPDVYEKLLELIGRHYAAHQEVDVPVGHDVSTVYEFMPTLHVDRNGAASTTTDETVANGWGSSQNRIVLRAEVPRTAAISVPAYGINIHSEHEVVVAGTAWKGWDAWAGKAPTFHDVPLRQAA